MVSATESVALFRDALRFAVVLDFGARVRAGEHFRFVEFRCPRACLHPSGKARRRLQRIAAFASEEIAQTKFCRVLVHSLWQIGRRGDVPYRGSYFTSGNARDKG